MQIDKIDIRSYYVGGMRCTPHGETHKKSLPTLSVVQAFEGQYGIGIGSPHKLLTGEGGVFVAPAEKMQFITHFPSEKTGFMSAHWLFLDTVVNDVCPIDSLFDFPTVLPSEYNEEIFGILSELNDGKDYFRDMRLIYRILPLLLQTASEKPQEPSEIAAIKKYISVNMQDRITAEQLAAEIFSSVPTVYRKISAYFGLTPSGLINSMRLTRAAQLLETTDMKVSDIAAECGLPEASYFSRLFAEKYGCSALKYRASR